jgi:hypothetical protein
MRSRWKWLGAGALSAGLLALVLWLQYAPVEPLPVPVPAPPPEAAVLAPAPAAPGTRPRLTASPAAVAPAAAPVQEAPMPDQGPSGIALFPAHGTKPIKRGIVVPEGYELPPGYVRHYQATDDGQRLPAILMFHPDFTPKGPDGQPVPMPPDRVVPPELAPRGMPVQMLTPPDDQRAPD